jgi:hypothetical protein
MPAGVECFKEAVCPDAEVGPLGASDTSLLLDEDRTKPELIKKKLLVVRGRLRRQQLGKQLGLGDGHREAHARKSWLVKMLSWRWRG